MISIIVYQMLIIFNDYNYLQPYKIKIKINIILNKHRYLKN